MDEKGRVIAIKYEKVEDSWEWWISYQDMDKLKRGWFGDDELNVYSSAVPEWRPLDDRLYIRGNSEGCDYKKETIYQDWKLNALIDKVNKINMKYGRQFYFWED